MIIAAVAALAMVALAVTAPTCHRHHGRDAGIAAHRASPSAAAFDRDGGKPPLARALAVSAPAHCPSSAQHEVTEAVERALVIAAGFGDVPSPRTSPSVVGTAVAGRFDAVPRADRTLHLALGVMRI